jgi:hypothetical protein
VIPDSLVDEKLSGIKSLHALSLAVRGYSVANSVTTGNGQDYYLDDNA